MATAVEVRTWRRAADPAAIDAELAALWAEIGRDRPVVRAMMSNLVIVQERPVAGTLDLTRPPIAVPIEEIARRHPARILLIYHVRGAPMNCPPIAAAVGVTTLGGDDARYGVETIAIESRCAESSLPSIIRRLTVGDAPTTLWWADDLSHVAPGSSLASMARRLIYDSRTWRDPAAGFAAIADVLNAADPPNISDLNWRRLSPVCSALASIVRHRNDVLDSGFEARLAYRPGERALADLLAGWVAARMRWPRDRWSVTLEEHRHGDDVLRLELLDGRGKTVTAVQDGHRVLVRDAHVPAPIVLPVPRESVADGLARELSTLKQDLCLRDAVIALAGRGH